MTQNHELLLMGDVARLIGIKSYRIAYALATGLVPEPAIRINNQRVFQPEDVTRLAQHFETTIEESEKNGEANE